MTKPPTVHQIAARHKKAAALVTHLLKHKFTLTHVLRMEPEHWLIVAKDAGVKPPSAETVTMVIERMQEIAKAKEW